MFWAPFCDYPPPAFVVADVLCLAALVIAVACIRSLVGREFEKLVSRLLLMWTVFMTAFALRSSHLWAVMTMDVADRLRGLAGAWLHTLLVPTALSLAGGIAVQVARLRTAPRLCSIISLVAFGSCLVVQGFLAYVLLRLSYDAGFNVLDPSTFLVE